MSTDSKKRYKVVLNLSIRTEPGLNAQRLEQALLPGDEIEVDIYSLREVDGFVWWQHNLGWSAERSLDGSKVFLEEIVEEVIDQTEELIEQAEEQVEQPAARKFKVNILLSVRMTPSTSGVRVANTFLNPDQIVEVVPDSRREADGLIWWQHSLGWSAEGTVDGSTAYMEPYDEATMPETPTETAPVIEPEPEPETLEPAVKEAQTGVGRRAFRVVKVLSVRQTPGLGGERLPDVLQIGTVLEVDPDSRQEVDGYIWWLHDLGWSAERNADGSLVFLGDPDATPAEQPDGSIDTSGLPQRGILFQRSPVDLSVTRWIQYFGNTDFAFKNGAMWGYPSFAQGLHSGFDFGNGVGGNAPAQLPVYAGVSGVFIRNDRYGVAVRSGQYVIIYQHLSGTNSYIKGGQVMPDTLIGIMDPSLGTNRHLHLEVRYDNEMWIINPLLMMFAAMRDPIIQRWSNFREQFSRANGFTQWQTPLDQPVILRGGPLIGPTAR